MVASRAQQVRAAARRRAVQAQERRREEERAREKRCADLGVEVSVALAQREESVERFEQRAGRALEALTGEGFTLAEAVRWSGVAGLSPREAQRLRRVARAGTDQEGEDERSGGAAEDARTDTAGGGGEPPPHGPGAS